MKTFIVILLFFALFYGAYAQDSVYNFQYPRRITPVVTHSTLVSALFLNDITPDLWQQLSIPYSEYAEFNHRRKTQGYFNVNTLVDYIEVEILATENGKVLSSQSTSDKLTVEQKSILSKANLGCEIQIRIKFKYKIANTLANKIIEGKLALEIIPEIEAEFLGGVEQRMTYFEKNVTNKLRSTNDIDKISLAIVWFTINEVGQVQDVKLLQTTTDSKIDKILLDAFTKMPRWSPAKDINGKKVKQSFRIPFGGGC